MEKRVLDQSEGIIQCIPNFSEGRNMAKVQTIVDAIADIPGVRVADWSADADHNRLVVTFVGPPDPIRQACHAACTAAVEQIDLRQHTGVHPRLGALDVLPFVPLVGISLEQCADLSRTIAAELATIHALPIFLYEAATPDSRSLPFVRREAFQTLMPDCGPSAPHPTAGASVVGARLPLIAFNVNLATHDIQIARTIARELRTEGPAPWPGVRALGLTLASRGQTQVSMNITRPHETPLVPLVAYVTQRAQKLGTQITGSEVIGALPGPSAFTVLRDALGADLQPGQILLENWPSNIL